MSSFFWIGDDEESERLETVGPSELLYWNGTASPLKGKLLRQMILELVSINTSGPGHYRVMPTSLSLTSMSSSESSLGGNIIGEYLGNSFGMIERGIFFKIDTMRFL